MKKNCNTVLGSCQLYTTDGLEFDNGKCTYVTHIDAVDVIENLVPTDIRREYQFVIEQSAEMDMAQLKRLASAVATVIAQMPDSTTTFFNITFWGTRLINLWDRARPVNADNREEAILHLREMAPNLGTAHLEVPLNAMLMSPPQQQDCSFKL